jgi:hypothetical protein
MLSRSFIHLPTQVPFVWSLDWLSQLLVFLVFSPSFPVFQKSMELVRVGCGLLVILSRIPNALSLPLSPLHSPFLAPVQRRSIVFALSKPTSTALLPCGACAYGGPASGFNAGSLGCFGCFALVFALAAVGVVAECSSLGRWGRSRLGSSNNRSNRSSRRDNLSRPIFHDFDRTRLLLHLHRRRNFWHRSGSSSLATATCCILLRFQELLNELLLRQVHQHAHADLFLHFLHVAPELFATSPEDLSQLLHAPVLEDEDGVRPLHRVQVFRA